MKAIRIGAIVVGLIVFFVAGYFTYPAYKNYQKDQVAKPAKQYVADLTAGDNAKAYQESSSNIKQNQTADQFSQAIGDLKDSNPKYSDELVTSNKDHAVYTVTVDNLPADNLGSTNAIVQLGLIKQDGNWVVDSVNIQ